MIRKLLIPLVFIVPVSQSVMADYLLAKDDEPSLNLKQRVTKMMLTDSSFVEQVIESDQSEIELGQLALNKSANPEIQKFAQQMIKEHGSSSGELKIIAQSRNIKLPKDSETSTNKDLEGLNLLSSAEFDRTYVKKMNDEHEKAVSLFKAAAADDTLDSQVKQFAEKMLPILREHRTHANSLNNAISAVR